MPGFHRKPVGRWRAAFMRSSEFASQSLKWWLLAQQRQQAREVNGISHITSGSVS
jgi:hypothetical protein